MIGNLRREHFGKDSRGQTGFGEVRKDGDKSMGRCPKNKGLAKVSPFTTQLMAFHFLLPSIEEARTESCT